MSRELKFRAYVERDETNEFFPGQESYMVTQGEPDVETLQSFMFHYGDEKNIMQSAGLKDKNGREIYEGDIVMYWRGDTLAGTYREHIGVIKWKQEAACFYIQCGKYYQEIYALAMSGDDETVDNLIIQGNIYENKNLLTHE